MGLMGCHLAHARTSAPPLGINPIEKSARKEPRSIAFSSAGIALFAIIHTNYVPEDDTAQMVLVRVTAGRAQQSRPRIAFATDGNCRRSACSLDGKGGAVVLKQGRGAK
jgi:hypothetical protein